MDRRGQHAQLEQHPTRPSSQHHRRTRTARDSKRSSATTSPNATREARPRSTRASCLVAKKAAWQARGSTPGAAEQFQTLEITRSGYGVKATALMSVEIWHDVGRTMCVWPCPRRDGQSCGVIVELHRPQRPFDKVWSWDGNESAPTLTPSVNCNGEAGCGWHGFVQNGKLVGA